MCSFISIGRIDRDSLLSIVDRANFFSSGRQGARTLLSGSVIGTYFQETSTRTRTSFSVGAMRLGAQVLAYGPNDLQIKTGESIEDTGRVLSGYLDAIVVRANVPASVMDCLAIDGMPVINAMSCEEHPTQAVSDFAMLKEKFGRLDGLHLLYIGEGNSTATALLLAAATVGNMRFTALTPPGYGLPKSFLEKAEQIAHHSGSTIEEFHTIDRAPTGVDAIYTTQWRTTGTSKEDPIWLETFAPFRVTPQLMDKVSDGSKTIFMHDLPARRGEEVSTAVLQGSQSFAFRQAEYKMYGAMAVLEWVLRGKL